MYEQYRFYKDYDICTLKYKLLIEKYNERFGIYEECLRKDFDSETELHDFMSKFIKENVT